MLSSCAGETFHEIIIEPTYVMFRFDNATHDATAYGYKFSNGEVVKDLKLPAEIKVVDATYKVSTISERAFASGPWTSVTLGANINTIGKQAFSDCNDIKIVKVECTTLPTITEDVFPQTVYESATLLISSSLDLSGTPWANFSNITLL